MDGEHCRHESARPETAGHLPQNQEEQNRHGRVQHYIGRVMPGGVLRSVEFAVECMGKPGQRVPIAGVESGERPGDAFAAQSVRHVGIVVDVGIVVEVDEIVLDGSSEDDRHHQQQKPADGRREIPISSWSVVHNLVLPKRI